MGVMRFSRRQIPRSYRLVLNALFLKGIRYYNGLTIYPVEYLRQTSIGAQGFGFHAEALLKAVNAGYSFLEIALPVDTQILANARSFTFHNVIVEILTIFRLLFEFYILR